MGRFVVAMTAATALAGCPTHFQSIAVQAANEQTKTCHSTVKAYPLSEDWAFRIDTCEGVTYWRCWSRRTGKRHGEYGTRDDVWWPRDRAQCCARVPNEAAALTPYFHMASSFAMVEDDSSTACEGWP